MRVFRRSKGEKERDSQASSVSGKHSHISVPHKDAIAIQPPKKVIKALYDYQVTNPAEQDLYLSFNAGDFLHVVGRETDPDWYEACNPIHGIRGLVPVNHFEEIGKTGSGAGGAGVGVGVGAFAKDPSSATGHDSGFGELDHNSVNGVDSGQAQGWKSMGRGSGGGAMVYGIVQYDFTAERPDELDAKAGEAIIVIAQSNPEWFVAKPITRLGGPGLIPVSYIEIRDMTTGQAVPDTMGAVARAGVPKVEEWKKMAAEYKNSSIPLGQVTSPAPQAPSNHQQSRQTYDPSNSRYGGQDNASQLRASQLITAIRARIVKFYYRAEDKEFWYMVDTTMEDGRTWNLERSYKDFYGLQTLLLEQFPEAAGKVPGQPRTLPYIPGPLPWVTEHVTNERRPKLNQYLATLLKMSTQITNSTPVCNFFAPRENDVERYPGEEAQQQFDDMRLSSASQGSSQHQHQQYESSQQPDLNGGINGSGGMTGSSSSPPPQQQHLAPSQQMKMSPPHTAPHSRSPSDLRAMHPPMLRNNSNLTTGSGTSNMSHAAATNAAVKIKVWFGETNCVVIRLPAGFTYTDLLAKLRDRYSVEPGVDRERAQESDFMVEYKDEASGGYYKLNGDDELEIARARNDKLTLKVQAMSQM